MEDIEYVIEDEELPPTEETEEDASTEDEDGKGEADGAGGGAAAAGEDEEEKPKLSKKERQAIRAREHKALTAERERAETLARENRELQAQIARAVTDATARMTEVVERTAPKPKPKIEEAKEKLRAYAKQVRDDDPATTERFLDGILEQAQELTREDARAVMQEEMAKFQRTLPTPPSPQWTRLTAQFPWITDQDNGAAVRAKANRIAQREKRNMNDPVVKEKTWAEAASKYAREEGLEVYDTRGTPAPADRERAKQRVAGTGGRNGGGGGGGGDSGGGAGIIAAVRNNPVARAAADKFYGHLKGDARYAAYAKEVVQPELAAAGGRSARR